MADLAWPFYSKENIFFIIKRSRLEFKNRTQSVWKMAIRILDCSVFGGLLYLNLLSKKVTMIFKIWKISTAYNHLEHPTWILATTNFVVWIFFKSLTFFRDEPVPVEPYLTPLDYFHRGHFLSGLQFVEEAPTQRGKKSEADSIIFDYCNQGWDSPSSTSTVFLW
jgi:hypothetical protein